MAIKQTFEQSLAQLERSVEELETGSLSLDQALSSFETGVKHAARCQELLKKAENKVELLLKGKDGAIVFEAFETDEGSN
jgi:exodeoxyribonuclease VII small subunit